MALDEAAAVLEPAFDIKNAATQAPDPGGTYTVRARGLWVEEPRQEYDGSRPGATPKLSAKMIVFSAVGV